MIDPSISHDAEIGHITRCQICGDKDLELCIDLGHYAPCDTLLTPGQLNGAEETFPLRFLRCTNCGLAQIDYVVPPEKLFYPEYPYRSGITETLKNNLFNIAKVMVKTVGLEPDDFVIDIGSNDGSILEGFKASGMRVLGVEPTNVADIAIENGIDTIKKFFSEEVAEEIHAHYGPVDLITAANMFAHIPNLGSCMRGVSKLLKDGGTFLTESHYLLDIFQTVQYDSIYHEHLRFYSLKPMMKLVEHYGFSITDVERIPNYGGSIRVYATKGKGLPASDRLKALLEEEVEAGLYDKSTSDRFRDRCIQAKMQLQETLVDLRRDGKSIVGVGCPGRSATLLNYCRLDTDFLPYIAEQSTSLKLGLYTPQTHIPVIDEQRMFDEQPDYALMLSWHYAEPIMRKLRQRGLKSKFIVPLPEVRIVDDVG